MVPSLNGFDVLKGVRVVELTSWISGSYAGAMLAGLGADVIKVEPPQGDSWRDATGMYSFSALNRNKRGIVVDLTKEDGRKVIHELVERSDVFLENMAPDTIRKFGLTYEDLRAINPKIIYGSIKGFGEGPYESYTATDPAIQAISGSMEVTGHPDRPPARTLVSYIDDSTALYMAFAVLVALRRRDLTGEGAFLELSLFDVASEFITNNLLNYYMVTGELPRRSGSSYPSLVPYRVYRTKDGYVYTGARNEKAWAAFCRVLGLEKLIDDPRFRTNRDRVQHRDELDAIIEDATSKFETTDLVNRLRETGEIIAVPVNTMDKLLVDPHLRHRGLIIDLPDPKYKGLKMARMSIHTKGSYVDSVRSRAPMLGEHTVEVLRDVLGYDEKRIQDLLSSGAVRGPQAKQ
ncbi:MAG: CaiB/BaiF CoA transferase family protein [Conexivisphaera sp.]|jgi:crotonobetainyl-CoA:carnitine CoA-transferase CaiB-like acyl-CoA transferase|nr:CoA transferase [Conexivisphaerales archaeon]